MNKQSTGVVDSNTDTFKIKQLTEENCRLHSVIEHIQASAPQWVSVDDRLPELDLSEAAHATVKVLVTDGVEVCELTFSAGKLPKYWHEWSIYGDLEPELITKWQPLPTAPEGV